jgi:hypothetical protein
MTQKHFSHLIKILALSCLFALGASACSSQSAGSTGGEAMSTTVATPAAATPTAEQPKMTPSGGSSLAGKNWIVNGDAESGPGTDGTTVAAHVPGWTTSGSFNVIAYGAPNGYPANDTPGPTDRGKNFFSGGSEGDRSSATQTLDLTSVAPLLATGKFSYSFSAWMGGVAGQNDHPEISAQFLGTGDAVLATATLPKVLDDERSGETALLLKKVSGPVPPGTLKIKIDMEMVKTDGAENDAYADNLSLVLTPVA